jgi:hypothetical protein
MLAHAKEMRIMSQSPRPPHSSPSPQPPQAPQPPSPIMALFDPKTITAATYPRMMIGFLAVWCFVGVALMFFGEAIPDTLGLILTLAETIFILARDREGFYTCAGFFKVAEWSNGQKVALAVAEVPGYFLALILYIIRVVMKQYMLDQQPAPLTPPAKRKRPQQHR